MTPTRLSDDLAYIRDLAEAGQNAPLLGGRYLAWWGGLTTLAYIGHYLIATGQFGLSPTAFGIMWSIYAVLGFGGMWLMQSRHDTNQPGASSAGNRVSRMVWSGAGFVLFSYFAGVVAKSFLQGSASVGFVWSVPVVIGVYGLSQLTSGVIAQSRPLIWAGWGAIACVGLSVLVLSSAFLWLLGAAVAALTVFLPGILLMKQEPAGIV